MTVPAAGGAGAAGPHGAGVPAGWWSQAALPWGPAPCMARVTLLVLTPNFLLPGTIPMGPNFLWAWVHSAPSRPPSCFEWALQRRWRGAGRALLPRGTLSHGYAREGVGCKGPPGHWSPLWAAAAAQLLDCPAASSHPTGGAMGFGPELWCPQGHSALLRLQDSELRLLELMKKWMSQRAKSDREYAGMLHHMFSQLEKQESPGQLRAGDHGGQIGEVGMSGVVLDGGCAHVVPDALSLQSWWVLASRTEALSQILRQHAEELVAGPLAKLSLLIRDKQQLRRAFSEQWQQLSQEYTRVRVSRWGQWGSPALLR